MFVPGSLNGCFGRDGDGETPHAARAQGRDGASAGHGSPGRGAAGVPCLAAGTGGSGCLGRDVPVDGSGRETGQQRSVLRELWGARSCQFAGSVENGLVSDQFGQKPNVGRNHQKIPTDQIPLAPPALRGPQPPAVPVGPGSAAGARWGWHGGRRHGRTWGNPRHCEQRPKAPCPDLVAGGTSGRSLQR